MRKSTFYRLAIVLGVLVLLPLAACGRAQEAAQDAAGAAREAVGEAMEEADEKGEAGTEEPTAEEGRFVDNGDGTVRDANTGLIWLRNASCSDLGPRTWYEAKAAAVALESGSCGLSDGSSAGDWRLPTIQEFCSAWSGTAVTCPSTAASNSLVDTSLAGAPHVADAAGTGLWSEGDAFVGVQSYDYWSATELDGIYAWRVDLVDGGVNYDAKALSRYVWPVRSGG